MRHINGSFKGYGGLNLHYQCWLPPRKPRALLLLVHGLGEHSGRYGNIVDYFVPLGYGVCGFDYRGHGRSQGRPGYVERFSHFLSDLNGFLAVVRHRYPETGIYIVGHSVGGLIAAAAATGELGKVEGIVLSGAMVQPGTSLPPAKIMAARLLSRLLPRMGVEHIDATAISQDGAVVVAYTTDPLVYHGKVSARLGAELLGAMRRLPAELPKLKLPILIMHGSDDRLSRPEGSRLLYEKAGSNDKTLKIYAGFHHEIFNEPGRRQVFEDMEAWLTRGTGGRI